MVMVASVEVESPACTRSGPPPPQGGGAARLQPREWAGRPRGKKCRNVMQLPTLSVTNIHPPDQQRPEMFRHGHQPSITSNAQHAKAGHSTEQSYQTASPFAAPVYVDTV